MRIESYAFGRITVDGVDYTSDVILLGDRVICPWWRKAGGHLFAVQDLGQVIEARPGAVVLGTGSSGLVMVEPALRQALEEAGAEVIVARTARAAEEFNRLSAEGRDVAAALHLTC